jgi:hypothetical protein
MAHLDGLCQWELESKGGIDVWKPIPEQDAWEEVQADDNVSVRWSRDIERADESEEYEHLFGAIQTASRLVIAEPPNDDSEYVSQAAFTRAVNFLLDHAQMLMERFGIELPVPKIGAGPEGSVDLHWELPSWELLINIPAPEDGLAAYYGDDYSKQKTRGVFDPKEINLGLMTWLLRK